MTFAPFFLFLNQLKTLHWLTKSYAHHKILDDAYEDFSDKIDEFVESTLGMNNPASFKPVSIAFEMPEDEISYLFESYYDSFVLSIRKYANTSALESLIDDFDNIANKTIYLLRMK